MSAIFGGLGPYDGSSEWRLYEMGLKQFLAANSIAAPTGTNPDRRKAILLSSIGLKSLGVVRSLCAPDDPDTKSFDQLLELLGKHFGKPPTKSLARQRLAEAKQAENESIDQFIVRLRELSIDCQYDAAVLNVRLREQFIIGVRNDILKRKLLEAEDDSLEDLLKRARTFEQVDRDVRSSHQHSTSHGKMPTAHSVYSQNNRANHFDSRHQQGYTSNRASHNNCFRCGKPGHRAAECVFIRLKCN